MSELPIRFLKGFVLAAAILMILALAFLFVSGSPTERHIGTLGFTATINALEKDGGHIFDGAVIAAINAATGLIMAESIADGDGRAVFSLPAGSYRFQPSPSRENRVTGALSLNIDRDQTATLRLTELGPSAFGTPVQNCEDKKTAIESGLTDANYCERDNDCTLLTLGPRCPSPAYAKYNTSIITARFKDYATACPLPAYKCPGIPKRFRCTAGTCAPAY